MNSSKCPVCVDEGVEKIENGGENLLFCGGCQSIAYCSREHQKSHWKIHKNVCSPFKIIQDPNLGSQWIATRDLPAGTILLEESPILYYLNWTGQDWICLTCGSNHFNARLCSTCGWPICSEKCEQVSIHKNYECQVFTSQKIQFPPSKKVRKWFQKMYNKKLDDPSPNLIATCIGFIRVIRLMTVDPKSYEKFVAAVNRLGRGHNHQDVQVSQMSFNLLKNWINLKDLEVNVDGIDWDILKKMTSNLGSSPRNAGNEQQRNDEKMNPVRAIYVKLTQANHSCSANCVLEAALSFRVRVKTLTEVKKGQPLTDNYMRQDLSRINRGGRQLIILMEKGFKCQCQRCLDPTECGSFMDAIACTKCRPTGTEQMDQNLGYLLPLNAVDLHPDSEWQCNRCHGTQSYGTILKLTESLPDALSTILEPGIKSDSSSQSSCFKNLTTLYQQYENQFGPLLHPNHFGLMMAADGIIHTFKRTSKSVLELDKNEFYLVMNKANYLLAIADKVSPGASTMRKELLEFLIMFSINGCRRPDLSQDEKIELVLQADSYGKEL